jgi:DNA-binding IclR family transcriptional regulator
MLQLEGALTVTQVAQRLGVAASTAHRLLAMLVYRDFAVQGFDRAYRAGPVLEVAAHSCSHLPQLRQVALPHLRHLVETLDETVSLGIRVGNTVRFAASVEAGGPIRVGSREGMAFAAHRASAGLALLADLTADEVGAVYDPQEYDDPLDPPPSLAALLADLATVRRNGFAFNKERSEKGVIAVGVPVRGAAGAVIAAIAVSMMSSRYHKTQLPWLVTHLKTTAARIESDLVNAAVE